MNKKAGTIDGILIGMVVGVLLSVAVIFLPDQFAKKHSEVLDEEDTFVMVTGCENLDIIDTAICMNEIVRTIHNYIPTKDAPLNVSHLIINGGDCTDYSNLYINMAEQVGLGAKGVHIPFNKTQGHRIAIVYNQKGYCVLDQKEGKCFLYG